MKKVKLSVLFILTVIFAYSQEKNFIDQPYIEVSGNADTLVTPNEIFIKILLSEKDTKDRVSIEELELKMVNVLKALNLDIEKDLTTSDMTSNFKFYLLKSKDVIKTKLYTLKVKDAMKASQVFIQLEEIGISNTSIERVDHTDIVNIRNLMRTKAITDAKTRAIALTRSINQTVGQAIHISDTEQSNQPMNSQFAKIQLRGISTIQNADSEMPKIEFEKIKVSVNINAKFVLR